MCAPALLDVLRGCRHYLSWLAGVSIGVGNASFDFDVSTSYGGFNYDDGKTTVTSKNPPDGSKHIGTSRSYKGHVGKGGSDATVRISTSYGGVNFD